jgi:hypothetical protein
MLLKNVCETVIKTPSYMIRWSYPEMVETISPFFKVFREDWINSGEKAILNSLSSGLTFKEYQTLEDALFRGIVKFAHRKIGDELRKRKSIGGENSEYYLKLSKEMQNFFFSTGISAINYVENALSNAPPMSKKYHIAFLNKHG